MKKLLILFSMCLCAVNYALAQADANKPLSVHGIVKNEKSLPVVGATITIKGDSLSIQSDTSGYFTITAKKNATVVVSADGYEPTEKAVNGKDMMVILLSKQPASQPYSEAFKQQTLNNTFSDYSKGQTGALYNGSTLPIYHTTEETMGSRYFSKEWNKGEVYDAKGTLLSDNTVWLNYDKMSKALLVSKDRKMMIEADGANIETFLLKDQNDLETVFKKVPAINNSDFFIYLAGKKGKYELYKSVETSFEKANYRSDGMIETGHNYDLYTDEYHYYVYFPAENVYKPVDFKKKTLEAVFNNDANVKKYLKEENDKIDEAYLIRLVNHLNQLQ